MQIAYTDIKRENSSRRMFNITALVDVTNDPRSDFEIQKKLFNLLQRYLMSLSNGGQDNESNKRDDV